MPSIIEQLHYCEKIIRLLPTTATSITVHADTAYAYVHIQADTQEKVKAIRQSLKARRWEKRYQETLNWWEYVTHLWGIQVTIYAVKEAPRTCRLIEETVTTTEQVPVTFEEREVTKKVQRWECSS